MDTMKWKKYRDLFERELLDSVEAYQLRVVADLQDAAQMPGQFNQKVKIYLDGDGKCGVVGEYSIVIKVTAAS